MPLQMSDDGAGADGATSADGGKRRRSKATTAAHLLRRITAETRRYSHTQTVPLSSKRWQTFNLRCVLQQLQEPGAKHVSDPACTSLTQRFDLTVHRIPYLYLCMLAFAGTRTKAMSRPPPRLRKQRWPVLLWHTLTCICSNLSAEAAIPSPPVA